jgi:hypothetical protein
MRWTAAVHKLEQCVEVDRSVFGQLMRINSIADLGHVAQVFSAVPAGLIDRATTFAQGEALVAGKIASHPAPIRFGSRISQEGVQMWRAGLMDP